MELEDGSRQRSLAWAVCAISLMFASAAGCAASRHFAFLENGGRAFLLPPGTTGNPPDGPAADCPGTNGPPVTPRASHHAKYGCYLQTGFVELAAGMRLKVVKPVVAAAGEALKTETVAQQGLNLTVKSNAAGVETNYWEVSARGKGVAIRETGFDDAITHYRLFFLARDLDSSRKITLIGAASAAALDAAVEDLEAYCRPPAAPCLAAQPGMVIGAELPVTANGERVFLPLGATLREALPRGTPAGRITVTRDWRGRQLPIRLAKGAPTNLWLSLPLNGADSISW